MNFFKLKTLLRHEARMESGLPVGGDHLYSKMNLQL